VKQNPNGWVKTETYVVNRPYGTVTQALQRKHNECLNKAYKVTITYSCGFSTCDRDGGSTRYIPVSSIKGNKAEFYTKFWSSGESEHKPAGDRMMLYLAEVTPKGGGTQVKMYYYDFDHYQWTRDSIKSWAQGEDVGCPMLSGNS
jgi:hypothetical protein